MGTSRHQLRIREIAGPFALCRLSPDAVIPAWADGSEFASVTRTRDELSIVCDEHRVPAGTQCERGYSALRVEGTLPPDMVGVLVSIAGPLADAGIPIVGIGTYDTDYVLVRSDHLARAKQALQAAGHVVG